MSDVTGKEHYEQAELYLTVVFEKHEERDATWVQAWATMALAHATLAVAARDYGKHVAPKPTEEPNRLGTFVKPEFDEEPTIVFQGDLTKSPREGVLKKNPDQKYTVRNVRELKWHIQNSEVDPDGQ